MVRFAPNRKEKGLDRALQGLGISNQPPYFKKIRDVAMSAPRAKHRIIQKTLEKNSKGLYGIQKYM